MSSRRPGAPRDETLRELLTSPLDDRPPRRTATAAVAAGIAALVAAAIALPVVLLGRGDGGEPEDGTGPAPTSTTIAAALPGTPGYPSERILASMVNAGPGRVVMIGGVTGGGRVLFGDAAGDTWTLDTQYSSWYLADPVGTPESRVAQAAAYDTLSDVVVTFGGGTGPARWCSVVRRCISQETGDTWWFFPATGAWEPAPAADGPSPRFGAAAAYDAQSDRIVLFGGARALSGGTAEIYGDTWTYDFDTNTWTLLAPEVAPPPRAHAAMAYDPAADRILIWGGSGIDNDVDDALWSLDTDAATWTRHEPPAEAPEAAWDATLVFAETIGRMVLIGGEGPSTRQIAEGVFATEIVVSDRVWVLDSARTWSVRRTLAEPMTGHGAAYDPATERIVVFARGLTLAYDPVSDIWMDLTPADRADE